MLSVLVCTIYWERNHIVNKCLCVSVALPFLSEMFTCDCWLCICVHDIWIFHSIKSTYLKVSRKKILSLESQLHRFSWIIGSGCGRRCRTIMESAELFRNKLCIKYRHLVTNSYVGKSCDTLLVWRCLTILMLEHCSCTMTPDSFLSLSFHCLFPLNKQSRWTML